jgi:hypothetical protein
LHKLKIIGIFGKTEYKLKTPDTLIAQCAKPQLAINCCILSIYLSSIIAVLFNDVLLTQLTLGEMRMIMSG